MQTGKKNRSVGATMMNQTSSRSHSIFTIVVECLSDGMDGKDHVCVGKLNLVYRKYFVIKNAIQGSNVSMRI